MLEKSGNLNFWRRQREEFTERFAVEDTKFKFLHFLQERILLVWNIES